MGHRAFYPAYEFWTEPIEENFEIFINPHIDDLSRKITFSNLLSFVQDNLEPVVQDPVIITGYNLINVNEIDTNQFEIGIDTSDAESGQVLYFNGTDLIWQDISNLNDTNFANTNLTFDDDRIHQMLDHSLLIIGAGGTIKHEMDNSSIVIEEDLIRIETPLTVISDILNLETLPPSNLNGSPLLVRDSISGNVEVIDIESIQYTDEQAQDAVSEMLLASGSNTLTYNYDNDDPDNEFYIEVIDDTSIQKVQVAKNGSFVGARKRLNFIEGSNTTLSVQDNSINNRIDIIISATPNLGEGIVTSVALNDITDFATATGSPITSAGTLGFSLNNQDANKVFIGPVSGTPDTPTFRLLEIDDIPDLSSIYATVAGTYTDEQAQDAIGTILLDSNTIDFTYNDSTPSITAITRQQMSITQDTNGLKLVNDETTPTEQFHYGAAYSSGTKGWIKNFLQRDSGSNIWTPDFVTQSSKNIGGGAAESIFIGTAAAQSLTTGKRLTIVGHGSNAFGLTNAEYTSIFGYQNAIGNSNLYGSTIIGSLNDKSTNSTFNTIVGYSNLRSITNNNTSSSNTILGYGNLIETTGNRHVAIGFQNFENATSHNDNIAIGNLNGDSITTASNVILIGKEVDGTATDNKQLVIGDNFTGGGSGTWIDPDYILAGTTSNVLYYDNTTGEITYGSGESGDANAIIPVTVSELQSLQSGSDIDKAKWYRVTDATPVPCIVSGANVTESSALAFLEGSSDGTGITSVGGIGTYDLQTGTFAYGFVYDSTKQIVYNGVAPSANTVGGNSTLITFNQGAIGNTVGDENTNIHFDVGSVNNVCGNNTERIYFGPRTEENVVGENCGAIKFNTESALNVVGNNSGQITFNTAGANSFGSSCLYITMYQDARLNTFGNNCTHITCNAGVTNYVLGDDFQNCTIWPNLNGNKADNSGPIDFITSATFIYGRTSPWEIRDIDRVNELLFLYVTYGDGSDPQEGWYDPATDVFTPVAGSGGVQSVSGDGVDNTDPTNPVLTFPTPADIGAYADTNPSNFVDAAGAAAAAPVQSVTGNIVGGTSSNPTITQVQADWNQASNAEVDFIKNKPTIPTQYRESFMRNGQNQTFAAGTTRFLPVVGIAANTLTAAAQAAQKVVKGGTIPSVGFTLGTTQPGTGSMVWTLMRGATIAGLADTAAVITVAANSVAGEYTYTGNITVNDGDYLVWKVVNNASGASGQDYGSWFEILRTF